LTELINVSI